MSYLLNEEEDERERNREGIGLGGGRLYWFFLEYGYSAGGGKRGKGEVYLLFGVGIVCDLFYNLVVIFISYDFMVFV